MLPIGAWCVSRLRSTCQAPCALLPDDRPSLPRIAGEKAWGT